MSALHRVSEEFDERNLFLQVALGLLSIADRFDALLDRDAPDRIGIAEGADGDGRADSLLLLVLGAIATSKRLRGLLAAQIAAPTRSQEPEAPPPLAADALRRWLR